MSVPSALGECSGPWNPGTQEPKTQGARSERRCKSLAPLQIPKSSGQFCLPTLGFPYRQEAARSGRAGRQQAPRNDESLGQHAWRKSSTRFQIPNKPLRLA